MTHEDIWLGAIFTFVIAFACGWLAGRQSR
jgi:hypothetical protein